MRAPAPRAGLPRRETVLYESRSALAISRAAFVASSPLPLA